MKKTLWAVSICAGLLLAASAPAWAHHAFQAEFDQRKPVKLEGKVTDMEWINPHAWIHIDVKNPDGTVTNWMVECGSPNIMLRKGFTKVSLETGTDIIASLGAAGDSRTLTLSGFASRAAYQSVLRSVTYDNVAPSPNTTYRELTSGWRMRHVRQDYRVVLFRAKDLQ